MGLLFIFSREDNILLWVLLLLSLGLTYWECRDRRYRTKITLWWLLFVFTLAHVAGYIILRFLVPSHSKKAH